MSTIDSALARVTSVFARYPRPDQVFFCEYCHLAEEIESFRRTPLADFGEEEARQLLVETGDHWESTDVYKHYLPVILRRLVPPGHRDAMYPKHPFETLLFHQFPTWPADEREAVAEFMAAFLPLLGESQLDRVEEWREGWASCHVKPG
jgi:hypothetical protein